MNSAGGVNHPTYLLKAVDELKIRGLFVWNGVLEYWSNGVLE
jgi:hypothetical protein